MATTKSPAKKAAATKAPAEKAARRTEPAAEKVVPDNTPTVDEQPSVRQGEPAMPAPRQLGEPSEKIKAATRAASASTTPPASPVDLPDNPPKTLAAPVADQRAGMQEIAGLFEALHRNHSNSIDTPFRTDLRAIQAKLNALTGGPDTSA